MIDAVDYMDYAQRFKEAFALNLNEYCDTLTTTTRAFGFDYEKFCQFIESQYEKSMADGVSIADIVSAHYGKRGVELIQKIL